MVTPNEPLNLTGFEMKHFVTSSQASHKSDEGDDTIFPVHDDQRSGSAEHHINL